MDEQKTTTETNETKPQNEPEITTETKPAPLFKFKVRTELRAGPGHPLGFKQGCVI